MQAPNQSESSNKMTREEFLKEAEAQLANVTFNLARLHGEPPCMYAIDLLTLASWPEAKREETLAVLRETMAQAEAIMQKAASERAALWERSEATEVDRAIPSIVLFKSIREDLTAYEDALNFVRSRERK